jgi:hypothetical protein
MCEKKNKKPYEPAEDERQGAPRAFGYELQMFLGTVQMLGCLENPCSIFVNKCLQNSILETVLLHARNLLEFFTGGQPLKGNFDEDSIRAGYFISKPQNNQVGWWQSDKLSHTKLRKNDINKSLSHLTFERIKGNYKWDDLLKIKEEIESAYNEFLQLLPDEDRAKWSQWQNYGC